MNRNLQPIKHILHSFGYFLAEVTDTNSHTDVLPSGEVKDSNVCCVCAYHQVRLTHTK